MSAHTHFLRLDRTVLRGFVPVLLLGMLAGCESFREGEFGGQAPPGGRSELTQATFDWFGDMFGDKSPSAQPAQTAAPAGLSPQPPLSTPVATHSVAAAPVLPAARGGSDYDATVGVYHRMALEGQAFAQYEMGRMYENGQGVPQDLEAARVWYRRAAVQNESNAVAALARLDSTRSAPAAVGDRPALSLMTPSAPAAAPPPPLAMPEPAAPSAPPPTDMARIVPPPPAAARAPTVLEPIRPPESYSNGFAAFNARDYAAAARIWEPLAQGGEPNSQTRMGYMYEHGLGVVQDSAKAADWYRRAAEQDDPAGAFNLGVLYRKGQGVPRDDLEARRWYERAARNGHPVAPRVLALMDETGLGLEPGAAKPEPAAPAAN